MFLEVDWLAATLLILYAYIALILSTIIRRTIMIPRLIWSLNEFDIQFLILFRLSMGKQTHSPRNREKSCVISRSDR